MHDPGKFGGIALNQGEHARYIHPSMDGSDDALNAQVGPVCRKKAVADLMEGASLHVVQTNVTLCV